MLIGVPKEIKVEEYRVGLVPGSVRELAHHGHQNLIFYGFEIPGFFPRNAQNANVSAGFSPCSTVCNCSLVFAQGRYYFAPMSAPMANHRVCR